MTAHQARVRIVHGIAMRIVGCACGWIVHDHEHDSDAAFVAHVALAQVTERLKDRVATERDASLRAFREASDRFHRILSALCARRTLESGRKLTDPMRERFTANAIDDSEIEKLSADGFEACVRMLADLGATDVTIHECTESDMEKR